jgi:hypothetical protein
MARRSSASRSLDLIGEKRLACVNGVWQHTHHGKETQGFLKSMESARGFDRGNPPIALPLDGAV